MKEKEVDTHPNQYVKGDKIFTKYLCVHDDTLCREMTLKEIYEVIKESLQDRINDVSIELNKISKTDGGELNVFQMILGTNIDKPLYLDMCEKNNYVLDNNIKSVFNDIYNYTIIECNYKGYYYDL
jgi:hypothetical protein